MTKEKTWYNYKFLCTACSFLTALLLWLVSRIPDVASVWNKPVIVIFVFFTVVTLAGFLPGFFIDREEEKQRKAF